jgi:peptidyl-prolyl cis-trans isomerase SurA
VKFIYSAVLIAAISIFSALPTVAQENEPVVIDEVVAQVNDGVLTLSRIKREMKEYTDALVQQGKKPEEAKAEIDGKQGELIANLIIEELLLQKGKEEGLDSDVDAEINKRFLSIMKEQNLKTLEQLYLAMANQGVKPEEIREQWRKQIMRDSVMQRSVDQKVYWGHSASELKKYFENNKQKFTKPETVTISDIFLNFAGRDEAAVKEKAKQLVDQLRKGADFEKLALENSDSPDVKETKGKRGNFTLSSLNDTLVGPIKATKVGEVTDPIVVEGGIEIIRVDERTAASSESYFDEDAVRRAMTIEQLPEARKKFLSELRRDAFIKISEAYRPIVLPHLDKDEKTAEVKKAEK